MNTATLMRQSRSENESGRSRTRNSTQSLANSATAIKGINDENSTADHATSSEIAKNSDTTGAGDNQGVFQTDSMPPWSTARPIGGWMSSTKGVATYSKAAVCAVVDVDLFWTKKDDPDFARGFVDGAMELWAVFKEERYRLMSQLEQCEAKIEENNKRLGLL